MIETSEREGVEIEVRIERARGIVLHLDARWLSGRPAFALHRIRRQRAGRHVLVAIGELRVYLGVQLG
jgi:hypothetical protein